SPLASCTNEGTPRPATSPTHTGAGARGHGMMHSPAVPAGQESLQYEWLRAMFPDRARPVGFYPLPTTRSDEPFDPTCGGRPISGDRIRLLYLHVPFCNQRCHYCRFYPGPNSHDAQQRFLTGAVEQLAWWGSVLGDQRTTVSAAFLGGGSPRALTPSGMS